MRLVPVDDMATRDALLAGNVGDFQTAPGWPHEDTKPGMGFLDFGGLVYLVLDDDDRIAGECGIKNPPSRIGGVEIGYGLAPHSRGHGLGTAAVTALVELLSARPDVSLIEAEVHVGNPPSWRILERLGFTPTASESHGYRRYVLVVCPGNAEK